jgi:hypothetical protein
MMCRFAASGFLARPSAWIAFLRSLVLAMGKLPSDMAWPLSAILSRCPLEKARSSTADSWDSPGAWPGVNPVTSLCILAQ